MKTKALIFSAVMLMAMFAACSDDPTMDAVAPKFSTITMTPSSPQQGDSVICVVGYADEGYHWYSAKYTWKLSGPYHAEGGGTVTSNKEKPTFGFTIPKDSIGTYTLTYSPGYVQASSLFPGGTVTGTTSIEKGTVTFIVK